MNKLVVSTQDYIYLIPENQIMYLKSDNSYTQLVTRNGNSLVISKSISKVFDQLNQSDFIKASQSYIVGKRFIDRIDKKNRVIILYNEVKIPYSIKVSEIIELLSGASGEELQS